MNLAIALVKVKFGKGDAIDHIRNYVRSLNGRLIMEIFLTPPNSNY